MRVTIDVDAFEAETRAEVDALLLEVANSLVNNLKREAPTGATGDLQRDIGIWRQESGRIVLGTRLPYAKFVNEGTGPHTPPFDAIQVWARRKLNDESAAGPVFQKIKQEGTDANPFVSRAMDATLQEF